MAIEVLATVLIITSAAAHDGGKSYRLRLLAGDRKIAEVNRSSNPIEKRCAARWQTSGFRRARKFGFSMPI